MTGVTAAATFLKSLREHDYLHMEDKERWLEFVKTGHGLTERNAGLTALGWTTV